MVRPSMAAAQEGLEIYVFVKICSRAWACASTPGITVPIGLNRMSMSPCAEAPTRTMWPSSFSRGASSVSTFQAGMRLSGTGFV